MNDGKNPSKTRSPFLIVPDSFVVLFLIGTLQFFLSIFTRSGVLLYDSIEYLYTHIGGDLEYDLPTNQRDTMIYMYHNCMFTKSDLT